MNWRSRPRSFLRAISTSLLIAWITFLFNPVVAEDLKRFEFRQIQMGTEFYLILYAPDRDRALRASEAAFARVEELEQALSDYRPDSELMSALGVAFTQPRVLSPDLFAVLWRSLEISRLTKGAFDVTSGPFVALWREVRKSGKLPSVAEISRIKKRVGYQKVLLNPRTRSLRLRTEGVEIDLGGIGKGFAADEVLDVLSEYGIERVLVDFGGDIRVGLAPIDRSAWTVRMESELGQDTVLSLVETAVATSGDLYQSIEIKGVKYSHIVDPKTGIGIRNSKTVTVMAPDAATADALATGLSVLGPREGIELVNRMKRVEAQITWKEDEKYSVLRSVQFLP